MSKHDSAFRGSTPFARPARLLVATFLLAATPVFTQRELASQLAELTSLSQRVGAADTRTRVDAFHRVWTIALASEHSDVKLRALELLADPVGSASDHVRQDYPMPQVGVSG
jgi:hypothetical protein